MEINQFDQEFQRRIAEASVPPPPFVWENVEAILQGRRRRRVIGYWATGILAFAVVATSIFYFSKTENSTVDFPKTQTSENAPADFSFSKNSENLAPPENLKNTSATTRPENPTIENEFSGPKIFSQKSTGNRKFPAQKLALPNAEKSVEIIENESFTNNFQPQTADVSNTEKVNLSEILKAGNLAAAKKFTATDFLKTDLKTLENPFPTLPPIRPFRIKNRTSCYGFTPKYQAFLLDAYISPVFADQKLAAKNPDFLTYKNRRSDAEHYSMGAAVGLRASVVRGGLVARGGLEYTQFTEVFDHQVSNYADTTIRIRKVTIGNETHTISDTTIAFGELSEKIYNRFGLLNLPVSVGSEFRFGKFGLSLNAGVSANLLFWKKGQVLEAKLGSIDVSPGRTNLKKYFENNAGLSAFGSLQGFYKLKNGTRVFVEPYFQRVLKPVSLPTAPVEQRYDFYGIKLGLTKVID